jgi:hypothetical protein
MWNWVRIRERVHLSDPSNGIAMRKLWHGFPLHARREHGQIDAAMLTGPSQQCGMAEKNEVQKDPRHQFPEDANGG